MKMDACLIKPKLLIDNTSRVLEKTIITIPSS